LRIIAAASGLADRIEHHGEATIGERQHQATKNVVSPSEGVGHTNRHPLNRSHPDALTLDAEFVTPPNK